MVDPAIWIWDIHLYLYCQDLYLDPVLRYDD